MRPITLKMQAFGPYRQQETIDFSELGPNRVFLIHGDTGSGKTSILDALVFALYGDTSGGERKADQMRCESAAPDLPTEVVFDFALGERSFRIRRRPQQSYVGARGALVDKQAEVVLWERTGCRAGEEGKPLAVKITEANALIKETLGFSCDQFRQVVVLPQGRFRELLASGSDKREEILRQLFRTERFRELESSLYERAKVVRRQMEQLGEQRRAQLDIAGAADDAELAALIVDAIAELDSAAERMKQGESAAREAGEALAAAEAADEAGRAVATARAAVLGLEARAEEIAAGQQRLDTGRRADKVQPSADRLSDAAALALEASSARGVADQRLVASRDTEHEAVEALAGENERLPERETASNAVRYLEGLTAAIGAWRAAEDDHAGAGERASALRDVAGRARQSAEKAGQHLAGLRDTSAAGKTAAAKLEGVRGRHEQAIQAAERCRRLLQAQARVEVAVREHDRLAAAEHEAVRAHEVAQSDLLDIEARWQSGRAVALAASLTSGQPCPVCGSTEHPTPATATGDAVSDEVLEQCRATAATARQRYEQAHEASAGAKNDVTAATTFERSILQEPGATPGLTLADAGSAVAVCKAELDDLLRQAESGQLEAEIAAADLAATEAVANATAAAEALAAAERDVAGKEATLTERAAGIPEALRAAGALERALAAARAAKTRLDEAFAAAQSKAAKAKEDRIALETVAKGAAAAETKAAEQRRVCSDGFLAELSKHGFADEPAWRQCLLPESDRQSLEQELEGYRDLLQQARGQLRQAESLLERQPQRVDVAEARAIAEQARSHHTVAISSQSDARNRLSNLIGAKEKLAAIDSKSDNVRRAYETVGVLAEVANGTNPGRVSFQRWVLGVYLDEVLVAASRKLYTMSKHRYQLQRQRELAGRGRPSGLDLAVFDEFSGSSRPAVTLSGGESFLAALALALGLAETVQEHSAGRPLETIFVDEGFGALDPDALDLAVDALMELQVSGRLVGVISHVPELKQVIPARLEVHGGSGGSSTKFIVP